MAWNEKNLDYEIETEVRIVAKADQLCLKWKEPRLRDWNAQAPIRQDLLLWLEMKRTSITRLKLGLACRMVEVYNTLKWKEPRLRDWNVPERNLAASVNILEMKRTSITRLKPAGSCLCPLWHPRLKWKEPRLRDWNKTRDSAWIPWGHPLKWKEPRLRDWNRISKR